MSGYEGLGVRQVGITNAAGILRDYMEASFMADGGAVVGSARVPLSAGWPDALSGAVQARLAEMRVVIDHPDVASLSQTQELAGAGNLSDVIEAHVDVSDGAITGTVRVPLSAGWPEALLAAVASFVADARAVLAG